MLSSFNGSTHTKTTNFTKLSKSLIRKQRPRSSYQYTKKISSKFKDDLFGHSQIIENERTQDIENKEDEELLKNLNQDITSQGIILNDFTDSDVKIAPSLSHIDKEIIQKSDFNIKKLLKKIDKKSVQYMDWMRQKQNEKIKQGYGIDEEINTIGKRAHELNKEISQSMQKSMHGIFQNQRNSLDSRDLVPHSNIQNQNSNKSQDLTNGYIGQDIQNTDGLQLIKNSSSYSYNHPTARQSLITNKAINNEKLNKGFTKLQRLMTAKVKTSLSNQRQNNSIKNLQKGEATYLDYKKRNSPSKTVQALGNLENPEQMMNEINIKNPKNKRIYHQIERESIQNLQNELRSIEKQKQKIDQNFRQSQLQYQRAYQNIKKPHQTSAQINKQLENNLASNLKEDMLQETMRINSHRQLTQSSNEKLMNNSNSLLAQRNQIHNQYSFRGLKNDEQVPLNHTFKEDQLKLLFKILKDKHATDLSTVQQTIQTLEQDLNQQKKSQDFMISHQKDGIVRSQSTLDILLANMQKNYNESRMKTYQNTNQNQFIDFLPQQQQSLSKAYNKIKPYDNQSKLFKAFQENENISKKVGDLIFLTSNAGSKLGDQKGLLKHEMDKKELKAKQAQIFIQQAEFIRSGSPDFQRKTKSQQFNRKNTKNSYKIQQMIQNLQNLVILTCQSLIE